MAKKVLSSFKQDKQNFNKHTKDGMNLLGTSLEHVGIIESITVSSDDHVITGNARQKMIEEKIGNIEPIIIETDGTTPVVIKRTDIHSGTKKFHEAALLANTVAKRNINIDVDKLTPAIESGVDVCKCGVSIEVVRVEKGKVLKETVMIPCPKCFTDIPVEIGGEDE